MFNGAHTGAIFIGLTTAAEWLSSDLAIGAVIVLSTSTVVRTTIAPTTRATTFVRAAERRKVLATIWSVCYLMRRSRPLDHAAESPSSTEGSTKEDLK
jgi:hypothetical protein